MEVSPGANATLSVSVERQFGFPGAAELAIQLPESAKGIAAQPVTLAADQSAVSLSIVAGDDATPGMYSGQVLVKTKFNDVESSVQLPVQVVVKKP